MKVLHLTITLNPEEGGGTQKVVCDLVETLAQKGLDVTIFSTLKRGEEIKIFQPRGVKIKIFQRSFFSHLWNSHSPALQIALEKEIKNFDLIHIHGIWHHLLFVAYKAAKKFHKPFIITPHGTLEPWPLSYKFLRKKIYYSLIQKRILKEASAIQAITTQEAKNIQNLGIKTRIVVIPNGINLKEFQKIPENKTLERFFPELINKKYFLFLGRLHPVKGLDLLVRAFSQITKERNDIFLVIAGPDELGYRKELEKILKSEDAMENTIFTGLVTEEKKVALLSNANFLVLPSYSEVRGISILEAAACGIPVIATHKCNFPEIEEFKTGILIDPDISQLRKAILILLNNQNLGKEMGENGKKMVFEKFTWEKISGEIIKFYQDLLGNKF